MKNLYYSLVFIFCGLVGYSQTGNNIKLNTKVSNKALANTTQVNKSLPLKTIKEKTLKRGQKFTDIPLVRFPDQKLKLRASKSWKITPKRPSIPGFTFRFEGAYYPNYFQLIAPHIHTRATPSGYLYHTYSGYILFTAQKGGEYRMKISLTSGEFQGNSWNPDQFMLIQLGDREIRTSLNDVRNKEVNVVFSTPKAGMIRIGISGVNPDREKASYLGISAIQIDKI